MPRPRGNGNYQDRGADCQEAVVDGVLELIERAKNAGWSEIETAAAVEKISRSLVEDYTTENWRTRAP
ncbi:hypothetical protein ECB98_13340 [Brucellaceae bacterium VT-16-1752]|nr:hypothetical protein ECB98_13340 [Brucellaceae bacterium VT-16-1752]